MARWLPRLALAGLLLVLTGALGYRLVLPRLGGPGQVAPGPPVAAADPINASEVQGILPADAIRAIDQPVFAAPGQVPSLPGGAPVIGVAAGGQARAYPIAILSVHEIVNDQLAGRPIAVTW